MNTTTRCERFESHLSAWLDDELERPEQLELLDHVVRCASCREFTIEARTLEGMLAVVRPSRDAVPPPAELWPRIERAAAPPEPARVPARSSWSVGLRAAAVLILSVGLGALFMTGVPSPAPTAEREVDVRLGGRASSMDDERFMELTTEVLRADPRYHAALYRVMEQVIRDARTHEASLEYYQPDDADEESGAADADLRSPV